MTSAARYLALGSMLALLAVSIGGSPSRRRTNTHHKRSSTRSPTGKRSEEAPITITLKVIAEYGELGGQTTATVTPGKTVQDLELNTQYWTDAKIWLVKSGKNVAALDPEDGNLYEILKKNGANKSGAEIHVVKVSEVVVTVMKGWLMWQAIACDLYLQKTVTVYEALAQCLAGGRPKSEVDAKIDDPRWRYKIGADKKLRSLKRGDRAEKLTGYTEFIVGVTVKMEINLAGGKSPTKSTLLLYDNEGSLEDAYLGRLPENGPARAENSHHKEYLMRDNATGELSVVDGFSMIRDHDFGNATLVVTEYTNATKVCVKYKNDSLVELVGHAAGATLADLVPRLNVLFEELRRPDTPAGRNFFVLSADRKFAPCADRTKRVADLRQKSTDETIYVTLA